MVGSGAGLPQSADEGIRLAKSWCAVRHRTTVVRRRTTVHNARLASSGRRSPASDPTLPTHTAAPHPSTSHATGGGSGNAPDHAASDRRWFLRALARQRRVRVHADLHAVVGWQQPVPRLERQHRPQQRGRGCRLLLRRGLLRRHRPLRRPSIGDRDAAAGIRRGGVDGRGQPQRSQQCHGDRVFGVQLVGWRLRSGRRPGQQLEHHDQQQRDDDRRRGREGQHAREREHSRHQQHVHRVHKVG